MHAGKGACQRPVVVRPRQSGTSTDSRKACTGHTTTMVSMGMSLTAAPVQQQRCVQARERASALWMWGRGKEGQLGQGSLEDCALPCLVPALRTRHVLQVQGGQDPKFRVLCKI